MTIVGGFANSGNTSLNITSVMGSVNSPFSFAYHLLNMSKQVMNIEVAPGTEHSFEYTFKIHPSVSAAKFRMAITVFYEDDEESFATTYFNSTVTFFDAEDGTSGGGGLWLLVAGAGVYFWCTKLGGKQVLQDAGVLDTLGMKLDADSARTTGKKSKGGKGKGKGGPLKTA